VHFIPHELLSFIKLLSINRPINCIVLSFVFFVLHYVPCTLHVTICNCRSLPCLFWDSFCNFWVYIYDCLFLSFYLQYTIYLFTKYMNVINSNKVGGVIKKVKFALAAHGYLSQLFELKSIGEIVECFVLYLLQIEYLINAPLNKQSSSDLDSAIIGWVHASATHDSHVPSSVFV